MGQMKSPLKIAFGQLCQVQRLGGLYLGVQGDFNIIRFPSEKKRGGYISWSKEKFSKFINQNKLIHLRLRGRKFTWSHNRKRIAMSRIDRFLIAKEWDEHFARALQLALPKRISNHCPIELLKLEIGVLSHFSLKIFGSCTRSFFQRSENGGLKWFFMVMQDSLS